LQPNPQPRIAFFETLQDAGKHSGRRDRQGADGQKAASRSGKQVEFFVEPAQLGENPPSQPREGQADLGGANATGVPIEEANLELFLQIENALRESGLSNSERGRRLEQAAMRLDSINGPKDGQLEPPFEMARRSTLIRGIKRAGVHEARSKAGPRTSRSRAPKRNRAWAAKVLVRRKPSAAAEQDAVEADRKLVLSVEREDVRNILIGAYDHDARRDRDRRPASRKYPGHL
jgi:hypothetical protein